MAQVSSCKSFEISKEHLFLQNNSGGCFYVDHVFDFEIMASAEENF